MLRNNSLKIMSVIIAVFLWIIVVSGQTETSSMSVPAKLIKAPKGYVAVSESQNVSVTVKGSAKLIQGLEYSSVILNIDVSSFPVGDTSRRLLPSDFKTPVGIEVVDVIPHEIVITLDQIASKEVKVVPTFIGEVIKGFKVESVATKPDTVVIEGAKSKLRGIDSIATLPINLSDISESSVYNIGFREEDGVKSIKPDHAEVRVKMRPEIIGRDFKSVPVECMDLKAGLAMKETPRLSVVRVSGRSDLVEGFLSSSVFVVNCSAINKPGRYSGAVAYKADMKGVEVLKVVPPKINFEIVDEKILRN